MAQPLLIAFIALVFLAFASRELKARALRGLNSEKAVSVQRRTWELRRKTFLPLVIVLPLSFAIIKLLPEWRSLGILSFFGAVIAAELFQITKLLGGKEEDLPAQFRRTHLLAVSMNIAGFVGFLVLLLTNLGTMLGE